MDQKRFTDLWNSVFTPDSAPHPATPADIAWAKIEYFYTLKARFYHTPQHISFCLTQFDPVASLLDNPELAELALWFHDIIYIMTSDSNELKSAIFFANLVGADPEHQRIVSIVRQLILDTTHNTLPSSHDGEYLADIDISSLGRPWNEFMQDSINVRKESPHLSDHDFNMGQKSFFERLLAKPRIFYTHSFYDRFEEQTRSNLLTLLDNPGILEK